MVATTTRELYLETGLAVLADSGYSALKLSEVCNRLGVTSGSFYHFFKNWSDYTTQLIDHWLDSRTQVEVAAVQAEPDPLRRMIELIEFAVSLPHEAEAAIRTWAAMNPDVREVQQAADRSRYDVVFDIAMELLDDRVAAHRYSSWANFVLTGYEQTTLPEDREALRWAAEQFIESLAGAARQRRDGQIVTTDGRPQAPVVARD
ncbi:MULTISPECIES: TetR/AcrR family transcriptional regulator [Gordonia]|uniref:TetR family transcriptional regulator n=1 Tax=Gordonia alkanivorans CGMCC 6845 TaxID=1423140 RepID=W9DF29_9ACTN|nr:MULTISPECIES: TetR/AcrR family transcriptional regulator [Gordonia]ETA06979.1 TetR family transcriptional regulator [Gordonia alkanivorans CGMCC 6845]MDH3007051.1 TetR/AcrR family transcriptional regulator [Gordonia alkanivorans]MDH3013296.1 TetR/AcrR family transcriptional regulator [Gordonia alkanivorans]MDH3015071.1 TetR/AcrR family transcriptional regulator [Gordonia alkanivorans]MDH3021663.1 TetR/AcrR family transcriptional regulator [Gordonia alkanivorans]